MILLANLQKNNKNLISYPIKFLTTKNPKKLKQ
jgi:hypothetical protein